MPEDDAESADGAIFQNDLFVGQTEIRPDGLHIKRSKNVPIAIVFGASVRNDEIGFAHNAIHVRVNVEKTGRGGFLAQSAGKDFEIRLSALREKIVWRKFFHETDAVLLAGFRMQRPHAGERIKSNLIGVGVQSLVVQST